MPRKINPGSIQVGAKKLAESLRPQVISDPVRVHVKDPVRAHMADSVGVLDVADYFTSDEVEGALQEIAAGASAGRMTGLLSGGTFDELVTPNGSTPVTTSDLTLVASTEMLIGASAFDASGLVVTLTAAGTYYVYVDTNPASPTYRRLVTSVSAPPLDTSGGVEAILLAKVVYDGTDVTSWQDGRYFVRNLDRKVQFSARQGEDVDAWGEGCFASLEAYLLRMEEYGPAGFGEDEKSTVLVRGTHELDATLVLPVDNLSFVADGDAVITGAAGFASELVDITGRDRILFKGITFQRSTSETAAIVGTDGVLNLRVEDCTFDGAFVDGLDLTSTSVANQNIILRDCVFTGCASSIGVEDALGLRVEGCQITSTGAGVGLTYGIQLIGVEDVLIESTTIQDVVTGVDVSSVEGFTLIDSTLRGVAVGVSFQSVAPLSENVIVEGCTIVLDVAEGVAGVQAEGVQTMYVTSSTFICPRTVFTLGEVPYGVWFNATGLAGASAALKILNNTFDGFYDFSAQDGAAVLLEGDGAAGDPLRDVLVLGNIALRGGGVTLTDQVENILIQSNNLDGYRTTVQHLPGISYLATVGGTARNIVVRDNQIRRFGGGISIEGLSSGVVEQVLVEANTISQIARSQTTRADTYADIGTKGVGCVDCREVIFRGNVVSIIGVAYDDSGTPIVFPDNIWSLPLYTRNCESLSIESNEITTPQSQALGSSYGLVVELGGVGSSGNYDGFRVLNNRVFHDDANAISHSGVLFCVSDGADSLSMSNLDIQGNTVAANLVGNRYQHAIRLQVEDIESGVVYGGGLSHVTITDNILRGFDNTAVSFVADPSPGSQVFPIALDRLRVVNNQIEGLSPASGSQESILVSASYDSAVVSVTNVAIVGNEISGYDYGIYVRVEGGATPAIFRGLSVVENRVPFLRADSVASSCAIWVERAGPHEDSVPHGISLSHNRLGLGTSGPTLPDIALHVDVGESGLTGLSVMGNVMTADSLGNDYPTDHPAVLVVADGGGTNLTLADVEFSGNQMGGPASGYRNAVVFDLTDCDVSRMSIQGNTLAAYTASPIGASPYSQALLVSLTSTGADTTASLILVSNNILSSGVLRVVSDGVSLVGLQVEGNSVEGPALSVAAPNLPYGAIDIRGANTAGVANVLGSDIVVLSNTVAGAGNGVYVSLEDWTQVGQVLVDGNTIATPLNGNALADGGNGVYFEVLSAGTIPLTGVSISRNLISDFTDGFGIMVDLSGSNEMELEGLSVVGNTVSGPHADTGSYGALNVLFDSVVAGRYQGITVDDNQVGPLRGVYPLRGIYVEGPDTTVDHTISGVSISGNGVNSKAANGTESFGVWFFTDCVDSDPYQVQDLVLDRNRIDLEQPTGTPTSVFGLRATLTCNARTVSISENKIVGKGTSSIFDQGLYVDHAFTVAVSEDTGAGYVAGVLAPILTDPMDFYLDIGSVLFRFNAVSWDAVRISGNDILLNAGVTSGTPGSRGALVFGRTRTVLGDDIFVAVYGFNLTGNTLRANKVNNTSTVNVAYETVGFVVDIPQCTGSWTSTGALGAPIFLSEGWVWTGNTVSNFAYENSGTVYGQCISISAPIAASDTGYCSGNYAQDDGTPSASGGWADCNMTGSADNLNAPMRSY